MNMISSRLRSALGKAGPVAFILVAGFGAFMAYGCVYALRKPFTAASFEGLKIGGVNYKIALVIAQVAGYALSKFVGIRIIAALKFNKRAITLILLSSVSGLSLLAFAMASPEWGLFWMFVNGFPLGMAWGAVFSYIEGRRVTEVLAAILCINFILSSGWVKTVGKWLILRQGIVETWMPVTVAAIFFPLLLLCIWLLEHLPPPNAADKAARQERAPMSVASQKKMFTTYAPGLILLTMIYLALTVIRDVRDNFAVELWAEMGKGNEAGVLTSAEAPIAIFVLTTIAVLSFVKNNRLALWMNHGIIAAGALLTIVATLLFRQQIIDPWWWMMSSGTGIFLGYVLFNGVIFDRLLAAFNETGNVGFLMYIADAIGYLGSVATLLWRNFGQAQMSWVAFFGELCIWGGVIIISLTALSYYYFSWRQRGHK